MLKQKTHINVFNQKTIAHLISYNTSQLNLRTPWSKLIWQWLQMDKYFLWFGLLKLREISSSWLNTFLFSFVRWFTSYNSCLYFNDDAFVAILLEFVKKGRNIKKMFLENIDFLKFRSRDLDNLISKELLQHDSLLESIPKTHYEVGLFRLEIE